MRISHFHRWMPLIVAVAFALPSNADAQQKKRKRSRERSSAKTGVEFKVARFGLEFHESLVAECAELMESGEAAKAVDRLKEAIKTWPKGASLEPRNELGLGLGMILLRSGRAADARREYLSSLGQMKNGSSAVPRARIMLAIAQRSAGEAKLTDIDVWEDALLAAAKQRAIELDKEHHKLVEAIKKTRWKEIKKHAMKTHDLWQQIYAVKTTAMGNEGPAMAHKHFESLAHEVRSINEYIDGLVRQADALDSQIRNIEGNGQAQGNYRRRRRRQQVITAADPAMIRAYNNLCQEIRTAWAAGQALVTEYEAIENQQPYGIGLDADVEMEIPERELPNPR